MMSASALGDAAAGSAQKEAPTNVLSHAYADRSPTLTRLHAGQCDSFSQMRLGEAFHTLQPGHGGGMPWHNARSLHHH